MLPALFRNSIRKNSNLTSSLYTLHSHNNRLFSTNSSSSSRSSSSSIVNSYSSKKLCYGFFKNNQQVLLNNYGNSDNLVGKRYSSKFTGTYLDIEGNEKRENEDGKSWKVKANRIFDRVTFTITLVALAATAVSIVMNFLERRKNLLEFGVTDPKDVGKMLEFLQGAFVKELETIENQNGSFEPVKWLRDKGVHGGGVRYEIENSKVFNRASVNFSQVHYEDKPMSPVKSATALSVILHPANPHAPSMHFHISYMLPSNAAGKGYWRMIADLNPSHPCDADTAKFSQAIEKVIPDFIYRPAVRFGDSYFYIPSLDKFRGTSHLFIAKMDDILLSKCQKNDKKSEITNEFDYHNCLQLSKKLATTAIKTYTDIVKEEIKLHPENSITKEQKQAQIDYHTLYMFQVLTLDRGTTHGLLAHSDNDVGTMGSIPRVINVGLLREWKAKCDPVQQPLVENLIKVLKCEKNRNGEELTILNSETRAKLAAVVRKHYRANPQATGNQAEMNVKWWEKEMLLA